MNEQHILAIKKHLKQEAKKKFPGDEKRQKRYIWGTINTIKKRMNHHA